MDEFNPEEYMRNMDEEHQIWQQIRATKSPVYNDDGTYFITTAMFADSDKGYAEMIERGEIRVNYKNNNPHREVKKIRRGFSGYVDEGEFEDVTVDSPFFGGTFTLSVPGGGVMSGSEILVVTPLKK